MGFSGITEMVSKISTSWEETASDIVLWATITVILLYSRFLYIRQALCQFLGIGISWNLLDGQFENERDNPAERSLKCASWSRAPD